MSNSDNLPRPTERFQRVLAFASDEADGLGHGFVTCQHLLYALSRESKGLASAVFDAVNVTPDMLHDVLVEAAATHDRTAAGRIDLADEARDSIERAVASVQEWGHRTLDTEHLLYGIVAARTSADEMLSSIGVNSNDVLNRLYAIQQSTPSAPIRDEAAHAYRLTLESAWTLSLAMDAARQQGKRRVTSVHLLMALLSLDSPVQEMLATKFNLNLEALSGQTEASVGAARGRLPLADDVQRILGYAIGEAWNRGHLAVTPTHLAMGLARADRHTALDMLADLGVSQAALTDALEAIMPPPVVR